jgi:hypothetical protein
LNYRTKPAVIAVDPSVSIARINPHNT